MTPFVQLSAVSVPQPLPTSELVTMPHPTVRVISDAQSPLILTKLHNSGKLNYLTQVNEPKQQINGDKHDDLSPLDTRSGNEAGLFYNSPVARATLPSIHLIKRENNSGH